MPLSRVIGKVAGAGDDSRLAVGIAGRADADAAQILGPDTGGGGRFAQGVLHRAGDVARAAFGRGRLPRFAAHRPAGPDDHRLDLRPAEVDVAAQVAHPASLCRRRAWNAAIWGI